MRFVFLTAILGMSIICSTSELQAGVYHVSTSGNDAADGSGTSPWRTLAKANGVVGAGDIVIVHAGQYSDGVWPVNSGTAGNPITFQAASGEHVVLNTATGIHLGSNSRYITVDGFEIRASYRVVEIVGSSYITIRNCTMFGGRGNYSGFSLDGASYCVIQNNYYDRQDPDGSSQVGDNPTGGDGLRLIGSSNHNLIEGNTVTRCEHVAFASSFSTSTVYQSYNVWRNNTSYNNHTNFSLQDGVMRCLFENNKGYYMGLVWTGGNGWCLQFTGTNCILRFNTLYDDTGTVYTARQWPGIVGTMTGSANGSTPSLQSNRVYNNTVYGETDQTEWKKDGWRWENYRAGQIVSGNTFKNNIVADAGANQINDMDDYQTFASMSNRYEGNLLYGMNGQPATVRYEYSGGNSIFTLDEVKREKPDRWASTNIEGNPLFVNTAGEGPAKDFSLQQGSPAIDAGVHLTTAVSAGSGTAMAVADAGYFMDGWGIPGVEGDSIKIESGDPVGIAKIDYSSNTLTLTAARSWVAGARVFYYRSDRFQGSAPDIGAHEFRSGPSVAAAPSTPSLLTPAEGSTETSNAVLFSWTSTSGSRSYRLQVASDDTMTQLVADRTNLSAPNTVVTGLQSGSVYYWRVLAGNSVGNSPWSPVRKFTAGADPSMGKNILSNSDFDTGVSAWTFFTDGVGSMALVSPGYDDNQAIRLTITQSGTNTQFYQSGISLETGAKYRLSFAAYSSSGDGLDVVLQQHGAPYSNYGLNTHITLSKTWALHSVDFPCPIQNNVSDGRLMFWLVPYSRNGDEYWIDRIVLEKIGSASTEPTSAGAPVTYQLQQNFPNPFNPSTTIQYSTPSEGKVVLSVFNVLGEKVSTLVDEEQAEGVHIVHFDAKDMPTGVYFYRLEAGRFRETRKMLLMK
jgi:hypothetical protein